VALAPVLLVSCGEPRWWVRWAWVFAPLWLASWGWWPVERGVVALPAFVALHAATSAFTALACVPVRVGRRWSGLTSTSVLTLFWWANASLSPHGTWGMPVYSQTAVPPLQVLAVGGPFLLLWLMHGTAASLAIAVARVPSGSNAWRSAPLAVPLGVTALAAAWGLARELPMREVMVGLHSDDGTVAAFRTADPAVALPAVRSHAREARALAAQGATLVVLPEKLAGVAPGYAAEVDEVLAGAAPGAQVVAGLNLVSEQPRVNEARVYLGGEPRQRVRKRHLVPGWEDGYAAGTASPVWDADGVRWGVAICKDLDFPGLARELGAAGAQVVAAPAWDFTGTEVLHAAMARFRAVEGGFALARAAQEGQLDVWDARGRSMGSATNPGGAVSLLARVAVGPGGTPYARWGDWVVLVALAWVAVEAWLRLRG
jgi:apolipoprotein N-acyltransferase